MVEIHPMKAARSIRRHFEKYQYVKDVAVLDKLRWHGEVVLSDVVRNHFTYSHAFNLLNMKVTNQLMFAMSARTFDSLVEADLFNTDSFIRVILLFCVLLFRI
jgi:hypothetical protein